MWTEPILHIDMDAFFVEVERRDDPSLVGRPVLVGGGGPRGVVASASYEARQFGAKSAMPMGAARRIVPNAVVVPPRHRRYGELSREVFAIFDRHTPKVESLSVDEAFLDVSGLRLLHGSPADVAALIRETIRTELGLPASAGIASNKLISKLASENAKPDGQLHVRVDDQLDFLHALPVERLWGVGQATRAALQRFGVVTIGDLAAALDPDREVGASQPPFHEGGRQSVFRSGPEEPFSGAEDDPVWSCFSGDWKCPRHLSARVADEKEETWLEVVQDRVHRNKRQAEPLGDGLRRYGPPGSRQFLNHKISDPMMVC